MPEKINFIKNTDADFVASQLPKDAAMWLYGDCTKSKVLVVPHALNSTAYSAYKDPDQRRIDIGFVGDRYSLAIGDIERTKLIEYFAKNDLRQTVNTNIRLGRKIRLPRAKYIKFLNSIRGTIGAESGTYYLEKTDKTQKKVEAFLSRYPKATFEEVYDRFFKDYSNPVNGKAISSRHFEPIGTKTCQILLEGRYNDILEPDVHYISLKRDYSNVDGVMERFRDKDLVRKITDEAYEYTMDSHTYEHRVRDVWNEIS
jgi:spore maturation protein CgeB